MEFRCEDPRAVVRAANVRATLDAFTMVPTLGRKLIERHRLSTNDLRPDHFVPVQSWLDALRDIQTEVGTSVLRDVGARIVANAEFPPVFKNAEEILEALDKIYYVNHRGDVGHYHVKRTTDGSLVVTCATPYPRHFEWGLVEGICRNKRAAGRKYAVSYADGAPGSDVTCTLTVKPQ